jgi:hypothetical protein
LGAEKISAVLMAMSMIEKPIRFVTLPVLYAFFACFVLGNELLAISNRVPGGNFPIEHKFSWARVFLFCGGAVLSLLVVWIFVVRKHRHVFLPSLKFVVFFALCTTLVGVLSNYSSVTGWCCEVFPTRYFGFPFSFLRANEIIDLLSKRELTEIIRNNFLAYPFFLDVLFWSNTVLVFLCMTAWLSQRKKSSEEVRRQVQSESR